MNENTVSGSSARSPLDPLFRAIDEWIAGWLPYYTDSRLLQVAVWALGSVVAATLVGWFLRRVVAAALSRTKTELDDQILRHLTSPIYVSMICGGLRVATERMGISDVATERVADALSTWVVLVWLIAAFRIAELVIPALAAREGLTLIKPTTVPLFDNLAKVTLFLIATYIVIQIWGGDVTGLLTAGGIAGIAVGFAARDTLANLFAGVFILADAPYKIGDYITLDSGERGKVTDIGIRSTRLLTRDDVEVTIPNAAMGSAKIVNESGGPHLKYRIRVKVGVAYGTDVDRLREVLLEIAENEEMVCSYPEPRVRFRAFGESSLDHELLCWVDEPELRGRVIDRLLTTIYKRLNAEQIEIPYAKRDLYIKEMPHAPGAGDAPAG